MAGFLNVPVGSGSAVRPQSGPAVDHVVFAASDLFLLQVDLMLLVFFRLLVFDRQIARAEAAYEEVTDALGSTVRRLEHNSHARGVWEGGGSSRVRVAPWEYLMSTRLPFIRSAAGMLAQASANTGLALFAALAVELPAADAWSLYPSPGDGIACRPHSSSHSACRPGRMFTCSPSPIFRPVNTSRMARGAATMAACSRLLLFSKCTRLPSRR